MPGRQPQRTTPSPGASSANVANRAAKNPPVRPVAPGRPGPPSRYSPRLGPPVRQTNARPSQHRLLSCGSCPPPLATNRPPARLHPLRSPSSRFSGGIARTSSEIPLAPPVVCPWAVSLVASRPWAVRSRLDTAKLFGVTLKKRRSTLEILRTGNKTRHHPFGLERDGASPTEPDL